jgi:hypothetical protein
MRRPLWGSTKRTKSATPWCLGLDKATPAPGVLAALRDADVVVLPPSNPVVSVGTILGVAGVHGEPVVVPVHLEEQRFVVAVVGDLVAQNAGGVRPPPVEVTGRDPDVAKLVDFRHS